MGPRRGLEPPGSEQAREQALRDRRIEQESRGVGAGAARGGIQRFSAHSAEVLARARSRERRRTDRRVHIFGGVSAFHVQAVRTRRVGKRSTSNGLDDFCDALKTAGLQHLSIVFQFKRNKYDTYLFTTGA